MQSPEATTAFFFLHVGASLSEKIDNIKGSHLEYLKKHYCCIFQPSALNKVKDPKNTTAGHDEISSLLAKEVAFYMLEPLTKAPHIL